MAMKASVRRKVLQEIAKLVNEMIQINETAYRYDTVSKKTSSATEVATVNAILDGMGPAVDVTGEGTTLADKITGILYANETVTIDSVAYTLNAAGWQHATEG
jgi:predicted polyphosphate/ATP-dependent NAD kinase